MINSVTHKMDKMSINLKNVDHFLLLFHLFKIRNQSQK